MVLVVALVGAALYVLDVLAFVTGDPRGPMGINAAELGILFACTAGALLWTALHRSSGARKAGHAAGVSDAFVQGVAQMTNALALAEPPGHNTDEHLEAHAGPFVETMRRITQATGASLDWSRGDALVVLAASGSEVGGRGRPHALPRTISNEVLRGAVVTIPDTQKDPRLALKDAPAGVVRSILLVPAIFGERTLGALRLVSTEPKAFSPLHGEALLPAASLLATHLWRAGSATDHRELRTAQTRAEAQAREAEARLDRVAANVQEALIVTDPERTKVLLANPAYEAIWGQSLDSLYARPESWLDAVHAEDRDRVKKELVKPLPTGAGQSTFRIVRPNKETRHVEARSTPMRDARGGLLGLLTVARDRTEALHIESTSDALSRRIEIGLDESPSILYAASPAGNYGITFVTPNVESQLGYASTEIVDDPNFWTARVHPEDTTRVFAGFPQLFEKGRLTQEYRFRHRDGSYRVVQDRMRLVRDASGKPVEIVGFWMDVTERKRAEEGLAYSLSRIKELQDSRTQLLNTIAHDLASPLTPINVQLALLREKIPASDKSKSESLEMVIRNTAHLQRLIGDLRDVAKLEGGKLNIRLEDVELGSLIQAAVDSFKEDAKGRKVKLAFKPSGTLPVRADSQRITQVLFNFITNALKFTPADGTVKIEATKESKMATVRVTDSGRGLTADEMSRLFKPFSQVHEPGEIKEKGTGLGLFICKGLVEGHGGKIFVASAGRGKGSTFGFSLPLRG